MLYSFNKQYSGPLPDRIRLFDSTTRTNPSIFTEEDLVNLQSLGNQ